MSFDGEGFVEVANDLFDFPSNNPHIAMREAELRACISRAYYGVFLKVKHYLIHSVQDANVPTDYRVHKYIRNRIREIAKIRNKSHLGKSIYANLDALRQDRNDADYEETFNNLETNAHTALIYASEILDNLKLL